MLFKWSQTSRECGQPKRAFFPHTPPAFFLHTALVVASAGACLAAAPPKTTAAVTPTTKRLDKAWKRYHNPALGYCLNYPSRWTRETAFEGTGLLVETGLKKYSKPTGEIDIGLLSLPTSEDARLKPASLSNTADSLQGEMNDHIAGLKKLMHAERLETVDQHPLQMQGNSALFVKNKYYDPLERSNWTEEVVFVKRQGELFRLELQCKTDQLGRFEPVFASVLQTLQFDCK